LLKQFVALGLGFLLLITLLVPTNKPLAQDLKQSVADPLQRGDTTQAINALKYEIEQDKGYFLNYAVLGKIYFQQKQYEEAASQLEIAVKKKSKHFESLYLLGRCYLELGRIDDAEKIMKKGIKKAKKEKHFFENGLGLVMLARKDYREADRDFRMAIVGDPASPEYHINLGDANFYQGIPSLAISEYKQALESDTGSLEVYYHWAEACLEMKDYTCAIEKLRIVLSKDSTHADAWMRAAGIYFKAALSSRKRDERKNRFIETIGSYKRYLELSNVKPDSSSVRVYFELAMSYSNLYGFEDAAKYFEDVLSIPYEARDIYFNYGKALWGTKRYVEAAENLLKHIDWVKKQDEDFVSKVNKSELYRLLGDSYYYRKPDADKFTAIKYYRISLEERPEQKRLLQNVAVGYHSMKSYSQAIEFYDKRIALGVDSAGASIYKNAGYCALNIANNGSDEEDDIDLDEDDGGGVAEEPSGVDPDTDYYAMAISYMQEFLKYNPSDEKVLLLVANTYLYQMADCANGVAGYERLLSVSTDNCDARKAIGYAYFGGICEKNYTKALKYLKQAYQCKTSSVGNCADADLVLWIGQCYHLRAAEKASAKKDANDDFKNAFNWYGKVLKCDPNNEAASKGQDDTRFEFFDKEES